MDKFTILEKESAIITKYTSKIKTLYEEYHEKRVELSDAMENELRILKQEIADVKRAKGEPLI